MFMTSIVMYILVVFSYYPRLVIMRVNIQEDFSIQHQYTNIPVANTGNFVLILSFKAELTG